jgi:hydroxypyruvate reductase
MVAAGKAAVPMATAAAGALGARLRGGLVAAPSGGSLRAPAGLVTMTAGHPVPDRESERAGRRSLDLARAVPDDGLLLVLLSGGASAMLAVPADGLSLEIKQQTTSVLLREGATIHELNTVRKHLSGVKGGRLAAAARGRTLTLVISDVVGDDPSVIASGPTVADPSTYADALDVLERIGGRTGYPAGVISHLALGAAGDAARPETPKPGDPRLLGTLVRVIGGRHEAMAGAAAAAVRLGYRAAVLGAPVVGEAREAAAGCVEAAVAAGHEGGPVCVVSSGETTVRVRGAGRGGRNQELALAASVLFDRLGPPAAMASVGTDGVDGPTDAAGAIADSGTLRRAASAGLAAPQHYLDENDAYRFFDALGDLIRTGPTGTNVGDLQVFLLGI